VTEKRTLAHQGTRLLSNGGKLTYLGDTGRTDARGVLSGLVKGEKLGSKGYGNKGFGEQNALLSKGSERNLGFFYKIQNQETNGN